MKKITPEWLLTGTRLHTLAKKAGISIQLEPRWKTVGQLTTTKGLKRYFSSTSFDLNTLGASAVACDKDYAAYFLKRMKYPVPASRAFYSPKWCKAIGSKENTEAAVAYANKQGYPRIVKPNSGSLGKGVALVSHESELRAALAYVFSFDRIALVQKPARGRDYRIVVLDGTVISAYERQPLSVIGDGTSNIRVLIKKKQSRFLAEGRDTTIKTTDPRIAQKLARSHLTLSSVPTTGEKISLLDNANLSAGGDALDVTDTIHRSWKTLARNIARDMNLRLTGIDIISTTPLSSPPSRYWILELNDTPGLDHYAFIGEKQQKIVEEMYLSILKKMSNA